MQLFARLRLPWVFSMAAAGLGLLATLMIVWFAGASAFAHYAIDLAKLSLAVLVLELVPSPYAIIRSQQDSVLKQDLATFSIVGGVFSLTVVAGLGIAGLFAKYSHWMLLYAAYLAMQRYFDVKLQAEGRLREYFQLTSLAVAFRVVLLGAAFVFFPADSSSDVIWASLSVGSVGSLVLWVSLRQGEIAPFLRSDHWSSARRLVEMRRSYFPYYLNVALKRVRDSAMPILCGALVPDTTEVARYLLAYRGLDFVSGQLRVAEALLANFAARHEIKPTRARQFLLLAIAGQIAAFAASMLLGGQTGFDKELVLLSFLASLFIYPYVVELVRRSDAYAELQPLRVTISLGAFVVAIAAVMTTLTQLGLLTAPNLILAPLVGQSVAALTYFVFAQPKQQREA